MPATTPKPEPVPPDEFEKIVYGLITPEGQLFKVDYYGNHSSTMYRLQEHGIVDFGIAYEKLVHISDSDFDHVRKYQDSRRVTQKQFDTMFDYSLARGFEFPWELAEVI